MITVPRGPVPANSGPKPSEEMLMLALAHMKDIGRIQVAGGAGEFFDKLTNPTGVPRGANDPLNVLSDKQDNIPEPPKSWRERGEVDNPTDDKRLSDFEASVSKSEFGKYETDKQGRLKVPKDWEAPSGFRGRVVTPNGVEMGYPGVMRKRTYK